MAAQGTATMDFGAFPGSCDTSVAVADAGIASGSLVEAWIFPATTADHSIDEHIMAAGLLSIVAGNVVAGVGFTVYGIVYGDDFGRNDPKNAGTTYAKSESPRINGLINFAWCRS